jgi:hypothetical protein
LRPNSASADDERALQWEGGCLAISLRVDLAAGDFSIQQS